MPRQNGTGPRGAGRMSGRGLGPCGAGENGVMYAGGRGTGGRRSGMGMRSNCRQNFGGGYGRGRNLSVDSPETQKELLANQKEFLQDRINLINEQLEEL